MRAFISMLVLLLGLPLVASAKLSDSARVVYVRGVVTAVDDNLQIPRFLARNSRVEPGETIVTGSKGLVQLVFPDQSLLYVKANSRIKIEAFRFKKKDPSQDKFTTRVIKGSMRALTGLMGKRNPTRVAYKTRVSTIGIRGTAVEISSDRVIVDFGQGFVQNEAGVQDLTEGQSAVNPDDNALPQVEAFIRPENDPAALARKFNEIDNQALVNEISGFCPDLAEDAAILLLGMQDQAPNANRINITSTVEGLGACLPVDTMGRLLTASTLLYRDSSSEFLAAGVRAGLDIPKALESVMRGLENPDKRELSSVLGSAAQLGISQGQTVKVLRSLQQNSICR